MLTFRSLPLLPLLSALVLHANLAHAALIGVTNTNTLYDLNTTTGAASNGRVITGLTGGEEVTGLTYGDGILFGYTNQNRLYSFNLASGAATLLATGARGSGDIAYDPISGLIYGVTSGQVANVFTIDPTTGLSNDVGSHDSPFTEPRTGALVNENRAGLAFNVSGQLWGTTRTVSLNVDSVTELRRYDPLTGTIITRIDSSSFFDADRNDIAFDPITGTLYFSDGPARASGSLWTLDPATAAATEIGLLGLSGTNAIGINGLAVIPDVPEPSTLALMGAGLAAMIAARRRR